MDWVERQRLAGRVQSNEGKYFHVCFFVYLLIKYTDGRRAPRRSTFEEDPHQQREFERELEAARELLAAEQLSGPSETAIQALHDLEAKRFGPLSHTNANAALPGSEMPCCNASPAEYHLRIKILLKVISERDEELEKNRKKIEKYQATIKENIRQMRQAVMTMRGFKRQIADLEKKVKREDTL